MNENQTQQNTVPQNNNPKTPVEVHGWSWGAFLMTWLWGCFNGVYISLLALIPPLTPFMMIILGVKGKEWAWKKKKWESLEHFEAIQKKWAIAGIIVWSIALISGVFKSIFELFFWF